MNRLLLAGVMVVSIAGLTVCAENTGARKNKAAVAKTELVPQKTCPVMAGAINKAQYVDVKGSRIYVCCPGCFDSIKKDPDKYIKVLSDRGESVEKIPAEPTAGSGKSQAASTAVAPAAITPQTGSGALIPQKSCPLTGEPIDKKSYLDHQGKRIYVCCDGCLSALKKDPEKAIKDLAAKGESVESIPAK